MLDHFAATLLQQMREQGGGIDEVTLFQTSRSCARCQI
jgi:hypothetical protein